MILRSDQLILPSELLVQGNLLQKQKNKKLRNSKFLVRHCPADSPPYGRVPSFDIQNMKKAEFHRAGLKS